MLQFARTHNKPSDFIKSRFIESVKGNRIDFNYGGKNKQIFEDITVEDAHWLVGWLGQLSDEQLKDAFGVANYSDQDVRALAAALRARINELSGVAKELTSSRSQQLSWPSRSPAKDVKVDVRGASTPTRSH